MTKIILTRHGHVEGIKPERFRGRTELPLTELGWAQAKALAARIAKTGNPVKVYTSPMGRCVATGQEIAGACGAACEPIEALNDLDYGQWQWRTFDEVRATWPELFAAWCTTPHLVRFPDGDSLQDLVARTANALRLVLERHASDSLSVLPGRAIRGRLIPDSHGTHSSLEGAAKKKSCKGRYWGVAKR
jgi:phosphoserine phosphatase